MQQKKQREYNAVPLNEAGRMAVNGSLALQNGRFKLFMQEEGRLIIYSPSGLFSLVNAPIIEWSRMRFGRIK